MFNLTVYVMYSHREKHCVCIYSMYFIKIVIQVWKDIIVYT
jgi:hypothetical protein